MSCSKACDALQSVFLRTCCAGLRCLEHLWFGVVPYVTDAGLLGGLGNLTHLRELFLYDVAGISDAGIEALAARLWSLEGLSLSKCHRLTNRGLESLARCLFRTDPSCMPKPNIPPKVCSPAGEREACCSCAVRSVPIYNSTSMQAALTAPPLPERKRAHHVRRS